MEIRRLRADEIEFLVDDLWLPFAREMADLDSFNRLATDPRQDAIGYRHELFEDGNTATYLAEDEERVVGYAVVVYQESPPVFERGPKGSIEEVYVVPDRRGEGIATALMDRVEQWAAKRGCERTELSVNADNDAAIALYESRGYSIRRHRMDADLV